LKFKIKKNMIAELSAILLVAVMVIGIDILIRRGDHTADTVTEKNSAETVLKAETTVSTTVAETEPKPEFVSKKDFSQITASYPHAYAWIEIPGTNIDYPIIRHPEDNEYYLRRDAEGNYSINGCIFSELYNSSDFTDPITLVYGHYVYEYDGFKFFGGLQSMYRDNLTDYGKIIIHHPDKELHYEVFAALPYTPYHILYGWDYTNAGHFNTFLNKIKSIGDFDANINMDYEVTPDDRLLVLSTCYNGNTDRRFIVVAKLVEAIGE